MDTGPSIMIFQCFAMPQESLCRTATNAETLHSFSACSRNNFRFQMGREKSSSGKGPKGWLATNDRVAQSASFSDFFVSVTVNPIAWSRHVLYVLLDRNFRSNLSHRVRKIPNYLNSACFTLNQSTSYGATLAGMAQRSAIVIIVRRAL